MILNQLCPKSLYLICALLSWIQLCRDYELFRGNFYPALKIHCCPPTANLWSGWSPQKSVDRDKLNQRQKVRKSCFNHQFCTWTCFFHQYCFLFFLPEPDQFIRMLVHSINWHIGLVTMGAWSLHPNYTYIKVETSSSQDIVLGVY